MNEEVDHNVTTLDLEIDFFLSEINDDIDYVFHGYYRSSVPSLDGSFCGENKNLFKSVRCYPTLTNASQNKINGVGYMGIFSSFFDSYLPFFLWSVRNL